MNAKKGRRYDGQFKEQALELLIHSGKNQAQIARDLGVSVYSLRQWKARYLERLGPVSNGQAQVSATELEKENQQLRRELERLRTHHEILKKALGILAEQNLPKSMP